MILYFPDLSFNLKEFNSSLTMLLGNSAHQFYISNVLNQGSNI